MDVKKYIQEANHVIDALTNDRKVTISSAREYWISYASTNEPALGLAKNLRTKAQIIARLKDLIAWLNGFGRVQRYAVPGSDLTEAHTAALAEDFDRLINAQRVAGLPVDEEGNDLREWRGNDIEAAHAEALAMNGDDVPPPAGTAAANNPHDTIDRIEALTARSVLRFARRWVEMQTASKELDAVGALRLLNDFMCYRLRGHDLFTADVFARAALYHEGLSVQVDVSEVEA